MFRLVKEEWPRWLTLIPAQADVPAVEMLFDRITRGMKRRAQREAAAVLSDLADGEDRDELEIADAGDLYSRSLIRQGARDWRGIGDAEGEVLAFSAEALAIALDDNRIFDAADVAYVMPDVLRDAEKNVSSASRSGISGVGTPTGDTASSSAMPTTADAAKNVPIGPMNRKARRAKKSGG